MVNTSHSVKDLSRQFRARLKDIDPSRCSWETFRDWCEMMSIAMANIFRAAPERQKREDRYLEIAKRYTRDQLSAFPGLLAIATQALERERHDFLGECYMGLDFGNIERGQHFTPYALCQIMAGMNLPPERVKRQIAANGFVTIHDTTCGAGATLIAAVDHLCSNGINYQLCSHITGTDIDQTVAHMCHIQLSLLNAPAIVIIGNTLTLEHGGVLHTPAHWMGSWGMRLNRRNRTHAASPGSIPVRTGKPARN